MKIAALTILAIPVALLMLLFLGETAGGGLGTSAGHLIEVAPLVLLGIAGWWWPRLAGAALIVIGAGILILYPIAGLGLSAIVIAIVEAFLALPVLAGALLFVAGSRAHARVPRP